MDHVWATNSYSFKLSVKSSPDCFGFSLLCSVMGQKNFHHFLNQSVWKLKPTESWSLAFYCILSWSFVWVWFYNNQSYCALIFEIVIFSISDLSLLFTVCTVLTEFDLTFGKSSLQKQHKKSTMRNKYSINIYMEAVE